MANALFDSYKENMLGVGTRVDIDADEIRLIIVDHTDDTPAPTTDSFLDDILAGARVAESAAFTTKTQTDGVFDADDVTLSAVSGDAADSVVIFKETGTESTSDLMVFIDTATGLPVTPNGGDIIIVWDSGANKIFAI